MPQRYGFDDETLQVSMSLEVRAARGGEDVVLATHDSDFVVLPVEIEIAMTPELQALLTGRSGRR